MVNKEDKGEIEDFEQKIIESLFEWGMERNKEIYDELAED